MRLFPCVFFFLGACAFEGGNNTVVSERGTTYGDVATDPAQNAWDVMLAGTIPHFTPTAADSDGDGYTSDVDCNDADPREAPDSTNVDWANDGIDQDCSGSETLASLPNTQFLFDGGDGYTSLVVQCNDRIIEVPIGVNGYGILYGLDPEHCSSFVVNVATNNVAGYTQPVLNANPDELGINDEDPELYLWTLPGDDAGDQGYGLAEPIPSDPCGSFWDGDEITWNNGWTYGYPAFCG